MVYYQVCNLCIITSIRNAENMTLSYNLKKCDKRVIHILEKSSFLLFLIKLSSYMINIIYCT